MYILTKEDQQKIEKYKHSWTHQQLQGIRNKIKNALIRDILRDSECYYCKSPLDEGSMPGELEHIVHKDKYPLFTYLPNNLILSCKRCNTAKGTYDVLNINLTGSIKYPTQSSHYNIVHAHIDQYNQFITMENHIFFVGIDSAGKGNNTIEVCNLARLDLCVTKIKQLNALNRISIDTSKRSLEDPNNMQKYLEEVLTIFDSNRNIYDALCNINKDKNLIKLSNELSKYDNLTKIVTPESIQQLKQIMSDIDGITAYINLISNIKKLSSLQSRIDNILSNHVLKPNTYLLNEEGVSMLCTFLKMNSYRATTSNRLITLISLISPRSFIAIKMLLNDSDLEQVFSYLTKIFSNTDITVLNQEISEDIISMLSEDIQIAAQYQEHNKQLVILANIKWLHKEVLIGLDRNIYTKIKHYHKQLRMASR